MLTRAGIECDLIDPARTIRLVTPRQADRIHRRDLTVSPARLRIASDYDRVVVCNERLIRALMRVGGKDANRVLAGSRAAAGGVQQDALLARRASGGLRVADFEIAETAPEAAQAAGRLGGRVAAKGRWGAAGIAVRIVDSPEAAEIAASELRLPVLVEAFVEGELVNTRASTRRASSSPRWLPASSSRWARRSIVRQPSPGHRRQVALLLRTCG